MGVNRVDFGGNTLIDLTGDTLESAEQLLKGIIAHAKDGSVITGLLEAGGGGGIELPTGYKVSTGTYTPNTEGTNVEHDIKIASSCPFNNPCRMFCIYRVDGFNAPGSGSARYLTFYVGAYAGNYATSGAVLYRNNNASTLTCAGGAETTSTPNYGLPTSCGSNRTNCYVRNVSLDGVLKFSTYGINTLESGKTYKWFALLPSDAEV